MAYEYEIEISSLIIDNPSEIDGYAHDELQEVYRKAKAFDEVIKAFEDSHLYTDEDVLEIIQEQLDELERADDER